MTSQGWFTPSQAGRTPPQPTSQNRYKITGTVVNSVTGEPIGRAVVRINGPASRQVFTDGSGRFEISDVPEGQFGVSAQRPGFLGSETVNRRNQISMITVGPATPSIELKLIPEGVIKGKITSSEGEPVDNVGIQIMHQQIVNGHREWMQQGGTTTDENGEYQIESLVPGQYLIRTSIRPVLPINAVVEGSLNDVYPPQYFPNAPARDSAQPVTVQPGQTAEADFRLSPVPSYSVSGVVSGPQNTFMSCTDADGDQLGSGRMNRKTGQFKMLHIPAGSCTLVFRAQDGEGTYYAEQPITVNAANVTNVQATLQLLPDIPIHFSNSTSGVPVQLQLVPREKHWKQGRFYANMQGNGQQQGQAFVFKSVPPGSYQVLPQGFSNVCISAMFSGGTDLLRDDLTVVGGNAQAPAIEVSLRNDCATLTGTINTNSPSSASSSGAIFYVLLMSGSTDAEPKIMQAWNGNFSLSGLTPGEYTVYAFSDISDLEYANPEALREYSGQKITLTPGEKATVQLNVIMRGDSKP